MNEHETASWGAQHDPKLITAYNANRSPNLSIIHIDAIYRAAHLIPVYGAQFVSRDLKFYQSYDSFCTYYISKYADHHAFEIA